MSPSGMLTSTQAAARLGVSRSRIGQLARAGRLPGAVNTRPANPRRGEWLIPAEAVERYADEQAAAARPALPGEELRRLRGEGLSYRAIAARYGVHPEIVRRALGVTP